MISSSHTGRRRKPARQRNASVGRGTSVGSRSSSGLGQPEANMPCSPSKDSVTPPTGHNIHLGDNDRRGGESDAEDDIEARHTGGGQEVASEPFTEDDGEQHKGHDEGDEGSEGIKRPQVSSITGRSGKRGSDSSGEGSITSSGEIGCFDLRPDPKGTSFDHELANGFSLNQSAVPLGRDPGMKPGRRWGKSGRGIKGQARGNVRDDETEELQVFDGKDTSGGNTEFVLQRQESVWGDQVSFVRTSGKCVHEVATLATIHRTNSCSGREEGICARIRRQRSHIRQ